MRYILDSEGYIEAIAFGSTIECHNNSCTEYIGKVPEGYESLCEWADNANIQAYKIMWGSLTYDSARDQELQAKWQQELQNNQQQGGGVTGDTSPIGAVMQWFSDVAPANWLLLNGQAVSRTDYSELFALYGTTFGSGDGSTTFNLPDMRKRVPVGKDSSDSDFDTLGKTGGEKTHKLTTAELPSHKHEGLRWLGEEKHPISLNGGSNYPDGYALSWQKGTLDNNNIHTVSTGGNQPFNITQPYMVVNYIVKAKQSAGLVATVVDNLNSTSEVNALSANQGRILNDKFIYSTEEKVIGKWIDGKPIYRKVLKGTTAEDTYATLGTIQNIDTLIDMRGVTGTSYKAGISWINLGVNPQQYRQVYVNGNTVGMVQHTNEATQYIIILEYTKTTD